MVDPFALVLALAVLGATLSAAVVPSRWVPEAVVAVLGAGLLIASDAIDLDGARRAVGELASTVAFLAALLVLAEGCRREGLFDAIGALLARRSGASPRKLLLLVFAAAAGVTSVLSLDATVVLLTPVVFSTATRLRVSPRPHVYACAHLANSASLLLPVSNLTNLLAFELSGLSFTRFAALMALPWCVALGVEWLVLKRYFRIELARPLRPAAAGAGASAPAFSAFALAVVGLTLLGFAASEALGVEPAWVAAAGACAISAPAVVRRRARVIAVLRSTDPAFLVFVIAVGVIVAAASENGLAKIVVDVLPAGDTPVALIAVAAVSALLANALNNIPATLIVVPAAAAAGPVTVLAALIGLNAGPNLTYAGSLATLLWRRVLRKEDADVELGDYLRLGILTVPAILVAATTALWLSSQVLL